MKITEIQIKIVSDGYPGIDDGRLRSVMKNRVQTAFPDAAISVARISEDATHHPIMIECDHCAAQPDDDDPCYGAHDQAIEYIEALMDQAANAL